MDGNEFNENEQGNQNQNEENDYLFKMVTNNGKPKTYGWSIASLVCGILSVVCCCMGYSAIIFGILAIALSFISRKNLGYFDGMSIAGLVLGIIGFILGVVLIIAASMVDEAFMEEYRKFLEEYMKEYPTPENNGVQGGSGSDVYSLYFSCRLKYSGNFIYS